MSSKWRPDDSLYDRNEKGELKGAQRVNDALHKHKVRLGNQVITSRDTGMAAVRRELKRERTAVPKGVEQWQMPVVIGAAGDILCFISRLKPRTKVPEHSHAQAIFRVVIEGSLKYGRKTLKQGDFMLVPAGVPYSIQAGETECIILYAHIPWPWPWPR